MSNAFPVSKQYLNKRCGLHMKEHQITLENNQKGINEKTKCASHDHIAREEYLEIVPKIIDELVEQGFDNFVTAFHKSCNAIKIYEDLKKSEKNINEINAQSCGHSNNIIKDVMFLHLYDVKDYKGTSVKSLWTRENLEKAFNLELTATKQKPDIPKGQGETVFTYMSEIFKRLKFNPVTIYSPLMTRSILNELGCKTVFDPCIGWGGRMLGTCSIDGEYTGCEPYTKTYNGLEKLKDTLHLINVTIFNSQVEDMLVSDDLKDKMFDCCLTSPPYYDLEVYGDEETQSINNYKSYDEWLEKFIQPIIKYVSEHCTKYSIWSVKNFKTDKNYNLYDDIVEIHIKYGWEYHTEYSVKKNTKNDKNADGDVTYVFKPKTA